MKKLLTGLQVCELLGISRTTLLRWYQTGQFLKPRMLTPSRPVWILEDVEKWLKQRPHGLPSPRGRAKNDDDESKSRRRRRTTTAISG